MKNTKITIVGAGNVGAQTAFLALAKRLGDVVLIDIQEGVVKGKALDLQQTTALLQTEMTVTGTTDYKLTKNSDLVIVTAGIPRKPGMSRDDLIEVNAKIMKDVINNVVKYSPKCILIIVSNPLDEMVYLAKKLSKFPKQRIIGMAGILDTTRYKTFLAQALHVKTQDIGGIVLGGHGDTMVPLPRLTTVKRKPISKSLSEKKIKEIIKHTQEAGGEIVTLLGTSAYYAPAAAIIEMVQSILKDEKKVLPCCAELTGEYWCKNVFIGVPCVLGKKGVEKIIELKLNTSEKKLFLKTVDHVKSLYSIVDSVEFDNLEYEFK